MKNRMNNNFNKERRLNRLYTLLFHTIYIRKDGFWRAVFLKKHKSFYSMGKNCYYHPRKVPADAFLISIGDNVSIAANVTFYCHDVFCQMLNNNERYNQQELAVHFDTIEIRDDVCIGGNVTIMPGVTIGPNAIIGGGSVVSKDVLEGSIVCGNPASIVGSVDSLVVKRKSIIEIHNTDMCRSEYEKFYWGRKKILK